VSSQGVVSGEKSRHSPGLSPIKGQKFLLGYQTGPGDELLSLSWDVAKATSSGTVLVKQPATESFLNFSPRDTQGRLRSKKSHNRAAPREPIGDLISTYSSVSRDPKEPYYIPGRDVIQRPLAL
jgi:hypothetical protein